MRCRLVTFAFITGYVIAGCIFDILCQGDRVHLSVSTVSPEPGKPVSLTCRHYDFFRNKQFVWKIARQEAGLLYYGSFECTFSNCDMHKACAQQFRITRCNRTRDFVTIEIQRANLTILNGSRWTCMFGSDYSNTVILYNNDPVLSVTILNASLPTLSVEEWEIITLVCVVRPFWKATSITWKIGKQTVTSNVTSKRFGDSNNEATVGTLRLTVLWKYNNQFVSCIGHQSSRTVKSEPLQLIVQVPLSAVSTSMSDTEQPNVQVLCETNPTSPPSRVFWMQGNKDIKDNVETLTSVKDGKTVTKCVLTLTCNSGTELVYCMGLYGNKTRKSVRDVAIMCPSGREMAPMMCYGGGTGVGVAVALLVLAVGFLCLTYVNKNKNIPDPQNHGTTDMMYITPQCEPQRQNGVAYEECSPRAESYDKMNPATREPHVERGYEDLRVYEKVQ